MRTPDLTVVGVDPGLANLGLAAVRGTPRTQHYLGSERITTPSNLDMAARLLHLHCAVSSFLAKYEAEVLALEAQYFHEKGAAVVKVGAAYGVILLCAAQAGVPVFEYGPTAVKLAVTGNGRARKSQVITMVRWQLGVPKGVSNHAVDAAAIALTHLQTVSSSAVSGTAQVPVSR